MLVLSRKEAQRVVIGERIVIHVLRTSANKVRLGVEAPANVTVVRQELLHDPPWCKPETGVRLCQGIYLEDGEERIPDDRLTLCKLCTCCQQDVLSAY